jgi:hypothetical protein
LLPLGGVGLYPPRRRAARVVLVPADNLGDFDVLPRAEPRCSSVRELLEDFLGGEIPVGVEEPLVV